MYINKQVYAGLACSLSFISISIWGIILKSSNCFWDSLRRLGNLVYNHVFIYNLEV